METTRAEALILPALGRDIIFLFYAAAAVPLAVPGPVSILNKPTIYITAMGAGGERDVSQYRVRRYV